MLLMAINNDRAREIIAECYSNNYLMSLTYKRERDGKQITRTVEPYEIKEVKDFWYLYAYDTTGRYVKAEGNNNRRIKSFLLENIISVRSQKREFEPRY